MNDIDIIRLMKKHPDKGIHEMIRKYGGLMKAIASRILTNDQDMEECVSDAFVGVWKHLDSLTEGSSLKGYLICTVRNNAINRYHKNTRDKSIPQSDQLNFIEAQTNLEDEILENQDVQAMIALIQAMEEPEREILIRKHLMMEPVAEIAPKLNMQPNQVKYRLQKAKASLKAALTQRGIAI